MAHSITQHLDAGQVLTVTADSLSSGTVQRLAQPGDTTTAYTVQSVDVSSSLALGPFTFGRQYSVVTLNGTLSYVVTQPDDNEILATSPSITSPTVAGGTITSSTITGGTSTSQSVVTNVAASGAITIADGIVAITKSSAEALLTLAAPTAPQEGTVIYVTSRTDKAHTITATTLIQDGVTGGAKTTATFAAFAGASIGLAAINLKWHVLTLNAVIIS